MVVGAGISGLAAAFFYRRAAGSSARILVLDNHDDFGGHAKRNEFTLDGRLVIGYGGSELIDSPNTQYSEVAKGLLRDLGVEIARFETAFERTLYSSLGLSRGIFFAREAFGRDVLVAGEPPTARTDELARRLAKPPSEFVAAFPISSASKAQLLALYDGARDPLAGKTADEKREILKRTSYRDYLTKLCGCSEEVANCFQGRTLGFFGLGCDAVPAAEARELGYPGFDGLGLPTRVAAREPYIYHFPDGNASLARLLVRSLLPDVARGHTMDDVVLAAFDYGKLDRDEQASAFGWIRPASMSAAPATASSWPTCAMACRTGSRPSTRCLPASTWSFHISCRSCRCRNARRSRATSRRRSSIATCSCATGVRGCTSVCTTFPPPCPFTAGSSSIFPSVSAAISIRVILPSRSASTWSTFRARPTGGSMRARSFGSARHGCLT